MIELPEADVLSTQIRDALKGRTVAEVEIGHSPHKFAWFYGETAEYESLIVGASVSGARASGGFVEVSIGESRLLISEGMAPRLLQADVALPAKRQLAIRFDDGSALVASASMYGGIGIVRADGDGNADLENQYYRVALDRPSPLSDAFTCAYFAGMVRDATRSSKLSVKALLATEQRIPGLGNGVLQDILYEAGLHPRHPAASLISGEESMGRALYTAIIETLRSMVELGGRDTERDLYGAPGGYHTRMSRFTVGTPCARCGSPIQKASYLGGSVYFCPRCQVNE